MSEEKDFIDLEELFGEVAGEFTDNLQNVFMDFLQIDNSEEDDSMTEKARNALINGDYSEAIELASKILETEPTDQFTLMLRANAYQMAGENDLAIKDFENYLSLTDNPDADVLINYGGCLIRGKRYREAVDTLKNATILDLENPNAWANLSTAYAASGEIEKAIEAREKHLEYDPEDPDAHYFYSCYLTQTGQFDEALVHLAEAIELDESCANEALNEDYFKPLYTNERFISLTSDEDPLEVEAFIRVKAVDIETGETVAIKLNDSAIDSLISPYLDHLDREKFQELIEDGTVVRHFSDEFYELCKSISLELHDTFLYCEELMDWSVIFTDTEDEGHYGDLQDGITVYYFYKGNGVEIAKNLEMELFIDPAFININNVRRLFGLPLIKDVEEPISEYIELLNHGFDGLKNLAVEPFDPNDMPRYLSVLHLAVVLGNKEAVKYLVEKGAEVDIKTGMYSRTPLHIAIYRGENQIAEFLIDSGADINAIDGGRDSSRTPLDFALETENDFKDYLIQNGAKCYDELDI